MRMPKSKLDQSSLALLVTIERKDPKLPRFVVVPAWALAKWGLTETTVVEGTLKGVDLGRRTLKRWDDQRWFVELPEPLCRRAGVETGDSMTIILRIASTELPLELAQLLSSDKAAQAAWEKLTPSQQRMLREQIASAKQAATRERRARQALCSVPGADSTDHA